MPSYSQSVQPTYLNGEYAHKTDGSWHLEDSPYKATQVLAMLKRHPSLCPTTVCDIGAGAGGVLRQLAEQLPSIERLTGYEVSPQAHALSQQFRSNRCSFVCGDAFEDGIHYDLALVLDVVEHVEDSFSFIRQCASKADWKIYNIPLDTSASMVLRGQHCWETVGHLHLFTMETAIKAIQHCGQKVVDSFLAPTAIERPHRAATYFTNVGRRLLPTRLASRLLGGYSLMVLAQ